MYFSGNVENGILDSDEILRGMGNSREKGAGMRDQDPLYRPSTYEANCVLGFRNDHF